MKAFALLAMLLAGCGLSASSYPVESPSGRRAWAIECAPGLAVDCRIEADSKCGEGKWRARDAGFRTTGYVANSNTSSFAPGQAQTTTTVAPTGRRTLLVECVDEH